MNNYSNFESIVAINHSKRICVVDKNFDLEITKLNENCHVVVINHEIFQAEINNDNLFVCANKIKEIV